MTSASTFTVDGIGELAKRAGTTTRALRFYESQGLPESRRTANGYREYDEDDLRLVDEIRTLQAVGLTLDDTRPFVECLRSGHEAGDSCADSIEVYQRKLAEVDACLERLTAVRADLAAKLTAAWARQPDNDENPITGRTYHVMSLPTLMLFVDGLPVRAFVGARPKMKLLAELDAALGH